MCDDVQNSCSHIFKVLQQLVQDAIASSAGYLDEFMGWVEHWGKEMHLIATCIHTSISKQYICSLTQMSEQHTIMYSTCIA